MGIKITIDTAGQLGVNPRIVKIMAEEYTQAQLQEAGFLTNSGAFGASKIIESDAILAYCSDGLNIYKATITSESITLTPLFETGSDIVLPVTDGDIAVFNSAGKIKDIGIKPSDATKTRLASVETSTSGNIAVFKDNTGTVGNGGVAGTAAFKAASDNGNDKVASILGTTGTGAVATFADEIGTISYNPAQFRSSTAILGGGASEQNIIDQFVTTAHHIHVNIRTIANPGAGVPRAICLVPGTIKLTFASDPGNTTLNYFYCLAQ